MFYSNDNIRPGTESRLRYMPFIKFTYWFFSLGLTCFSFVSCADILTLHMRAVFDAFAFNVFCENHFSVSCNFTHYILTGKMHAPKIVCYAEKIL